MVLLSFFFSLLGSPCRALCGAGATECLASERSAERPAHSWLEAGMALAGSAEGFGWLGSARLGFGLAFREAFGLISAGFRPGFRLGFPRIS